MRGRAVFSIFAIFIGAPVEYLWTFKESVGGRCCFFPLSLILGIHKQFPCNCKLCPSYTQ